MASTSGIRAAISFLAERIYGSHGVQEQVDKWSSSWMKHLGADWDDAQLLATARTWPKNRMPAVNEFEALLGPRHRKASVNGCDHCRGSGLRSLLRHRLLADGSTGLQELCAACDCEAGKARTKIAPFQTVIDAWVASPATTLEWFLDPMPSDRWPPNEREARKARAALLFEATRTLLGPKFLDVEPPAPEPPAPMPPAVKPPPTWPSPSGWSTDTREGLIF